MCVVSTSLGQCELKETKAHSAVLVFVGCQYDGERIFTSESTPKRSPVWCKTSGRKNRKEGGIRWVGVALASFKEELKYEYGEATLRALPKGCLD